MKPILINTSRARIAASLSAVLGSAFLSTAQALPVIGFDPDGAAAAYDFYYADLFSNRNDTVTTIPITANGTNGPNPVPFNVGDIQQFQTQLQVDSLNNGGTNLLVPGLNTVFELTKEIVGLETTTAFFGTPGVAPSAIISGFEPDNFTNLTIYYDLLADGRVNVPGDGAGTVDCYGSGSNANCVTGGGPGLDGDGTKILEANLVDFSSSFAQTGGTAANPRGTGAFDLLFEITYYDPDYIDVSNLLVNGGTGLPLFGERITGSLVQPQSTFFPDVMWNGVSTSANGARLFTIDSSQTFVAVPTPGTLLLMGAALGGLGFARGRRKQAA